MSRYLKFYQRLLDRYPIGMQAVQTALLMATGDCLSQLYVESKGIQGYDVVRTAKFASFGLFLAGPGLRVWYGVLDRYIKAQGIQGTLMKVGADQLLFAPSFLVVFISTMGALNGENTEQIKARFHRDYWEIIITNWKIWPAVQLLNFQFIPLQYRVLVVQIVAVFWNTFLAYITNRN